MITIGYAQADGSVKYLYTSDEMLQNLLDSVVYRDLPLPSKAYDREELKEAGSFKEYFAAGLSEEEDTRFRLLRRLDATWLIRDYYGSVEHDIVITLTAKSGGKSGSKSGGKSMNKCRGRSRKGLVNSSCNSRSKRKSEKN
jgi:hypothetical protein